MKIKQVNKTMKDKQWTCSEKSLPETGGIYLCVVETQDELFGIQKNVHCCYFNQNTKKFYWDRMDANITFWTTIPKIP